MVRIGICDDTQEMRFTLRASLERLLEGRSVEYQIYEFSSGDGLLAWFAKHGAELDLVFLDIEMPGTGGMDTARRLRRADEQLQMVFVTGHPDYVFDGYTVGALGYLLKPPKPQQLEDVLLRALAAMHLNADEIYLCSNSEGMYRIPKRSILYFFSDRRQVTCVAKEGRYTFYARLNEVEEEVGAGFVRIHQRYLVNAAAVEHMDNGSVTVGGETLPVSRGYQPTAMLAITRASLN